MKRLTYLALMFVMMGGMMSCSSKTVQRDMSQMPEGAQNIVSSNFTSEVASVETETNVIGATEYEVRLADGTEIQFVNEEWDEVTVPAGQSVPDYFVIEPIRTFVNQNQPGVVIVSIDRKDNGFEVELSNGIDIKFDTAGNFIKYDR